MSIFNPVVTALTTSTWTQIKVPRTTDPDFDNDFGIPMAFWVEDDSGFKYSKNSDGSNPATIPVGKSLHIDCVFADADGTVLYAQALSGTPNLVLQAGPNRQRR